MSSRESQSAYGEALMFALEYHSNLAKHGDQGTTAFLNFQSPISDEDCNKLVTEVLVSPQLALTDYELTRHCCKARTMSRVPYNTDTIKLIHDVLRESVDGQGNTRLGDSLDRSGVAFFLEHCHIVLDTKTSGEFFKDGVKKVLHWTKMHVDNREESKALREMAVSSESIDLAALRDAVSQLLEMRKVHKLMIEEMSQKQHRSEVRNVLNLHGGSTNAATFQQELEQIVRDRQTRMKVMIDDERELCDAITNLLK